MDDVWASPDESPHHGPSAGRLSDNVVGATFGVRAGARIIDMLIDTAIGFVAGVIAALVLGLGEIQGWIEPGWGHRMGAFTVLSTLAGMAASVLYHTVTEAWHGASLGKLMLGLRVVDREGGPASLTQALIRSLGFLIDGLFFGLVGYGAMSSNHLSQRYGDRWAGTVVVHKTDEPEATKRSMVQFLGVFAIAVAVSVMLQFFGSVGGEVM